MLSLNEFTSSKHLSEFLEYQRNFKSLKEDEPEIKEVRTNYMYINEIRTNMINWLIHLCDSLNFNLQTLFRTVIIFDKFISTKKFSEINLNQEKLNLITIGCLSLGTKLEEINCNYVNFLTEKVLNLPNCKIFTVKDLTKMELFILKELKYKTLYTTAIDFNELYIKMFSSSFLDNSLQSNLIIQNINHLSKYLMKQSINSNMFVNLKQSDYAYLFFNQALIQLGINNLNLMNIFNNTLSKKTFTNINTTLNNNNNYNIINSSIKSAKEPIVLSNKINFRMITLSL